MIMNKNLTFRQLHDERILSGTQLNAECRKGRKGNGKALEIKGKLIVTFYLSIQAVWGIIGFGFVQ